MRANFKASITVLPVTKTLPKTPDLIKKEVQHLVKKGMPGYTPSNGIYPLRKIISDYYKSNYQVVTFSKQMKEFDRKIKSFLKKKMYYHKEVIKNTNRGKMIIRKLFLSIKKKPEKFINVSKYDKSDIARSICDFIAGMTDRYAINLYNKIK